MLECVATTACTFCTRHPPQVPEGLIVILESPDLEGRRPRCRRCLNDCKNCHEGDRMLPRRRPNAAWGEARLNDLWNEGRENRVNVPSLPQSSPTSSNAKLPAGLTGASGRDRITKHEMQRFAGLADDPQKRQSTIFWGRKRKVQGVDASFLVALGKAYCAVSAAGVEPSLCMTGVELRRSGATKSASVRRCFSHNFRERRYLMLRGELSPSPPVSARIQ
jgi:hypothetical protein